MPRSIQIIPDRRSFALGAPNDGKPIYWLSTNCTMYVLHLLILLIQRLPHTSHITYILTPFKLCGVYRQWIRGPEMLFYLASSCFNIYPMFMLLDGTLIISARISRMSWLHVCVYEVIGEDCTWEFWFDIIALHRGVSGGPPSTGVPTKYLCMTTMYPAYIESVPPWVRVIKRARMPKILLLGPHAWEEPINYSFKAVFTTIVPLTFAFAFSLLGALASRTRLASTTTLAVLGIVRPRYSHIGDR